MVKYLNLWENLFPFMRESGPLHAETSLGWHLASESISTEKMHFRFSRVRSSGESIDERLREPRVSGGRQVMRRTKVFVAGFFDGLHPGHISFLTECAQYGDLYVSIGSDKILITLKKTQPLFHENERKYMLDALSCVKESAISKGEIGAFSFRKYFNKVCPDIFITNTDASLLHQKKKLCQDNNVEYKDLLSEKEKRMQPDGSKSYSSTLLRAHNHIPQRLDLVGFYDQVYINSVIRGSVILVNINPLDLKERAGMSSSTRNTIHRVFGNRLPSHIPPEELAEINF